MRIQRGRTAAACASALLLVSAVASGQGVDSARPVEGVFGGVNPDQGGRQTLAVSASASSGYENNAFEPGTTNAQPTSIYDSTGGRQSANAALTYGWHRESVQVGANAGAAMSYYSQQHQLETTNRSGSIGVAGDVGRRVHMFANQAATCAPARLQGVFPSSQDAVPGYMPGTGLGLELDDLNSCAYDSAGTLTYGLGRRSSIDFAGSMRYTEFDEVGYEPLHTYSAGVHFARNVSRTMKLRLGYTRRSGEYLAAAGDSATAITHDLDIGVDYQRALSFSRRTRLTFSSGSTIVDNSVSPTKRDRHLAVTGALGVSHELGRSWRAQGGFTRGVSFVDGFAGPVFSNGITASLSGLFTRRIDFNASVGGSFGNIADAHAGQDFSTYFSTSRVRYALNRTWAAFGEYTFLYSDVGTQPIAIYGSSSPLQRNAVRVGLTLWIPVLKR